MLPPTLAIPLSPHSPEPVTIPFVLIPACPSGFLMGSRGGQPNELPRHRVVIPRPFYLGKFPVTQEQFACFQPEHRNQFHGMPDHPAELISWHDAQAFINWLNDLQTLPANHTARLPCEAEWEYACRAGTETEYWNGDGEAALKEVGWYDGNSVDSTRSVGEMPPNLFGIHDVLGNVWEWCGDAYHVSSYAECNHPCEATEWAPAVQNYSNEINRVVRGGSWFNSADWCLSSRRFSWLDTFRSGQVGFRVLLEPSAPAID